MKPIRSVAHAMLGALFISSGIRTLMHPEGLVGRAKPVSDRLTPLLEGSDLPTDPLTLVRVNAAVQVAGGFLLASGRFTRPAALALAGSMIPTTIVGHPFWNESDPQRRLGERIQFGKNLSILGGLLLAAVDTGGKPSLVWRAGNAAHRTGDAVRRAERRAEKSVRRATWSAGDAAKRAERSVRRAARTTSREAKIAMRAASLGRRMPF